MGDWESTAFQNRHFHNRADGKRGGKGGKGSGIFDARKTFGLYGLKCPNAAKLVGSAKDADFNFEIFRFTDDDDGLVGSLVIPGLLEAVVLLAGSRQELSDIIVELKAAAKNNNTERRVQVSAWEPSMTSREQEDVDNEEEANDEEEHEEEEDDLQWPSTPRSFTAFEKNSFRHPKFWMQWQGRQLTADRNNRQEKFVSGSGYLVFSNNDCDKFQGTLSCETLSWDNVKISGWKNAWKAERDFALEWR